MTSETTSVLQRLQADYGPALEDELRVWLGRVASSDSFSGMMSYALGYVNADMEPDRGSSGKRFRPALCLLICAALGGDWHDALPAAAAIELLHNFSLVHDDVEDDDRLRRHRRTVWAVWGKPHAVNVGDGMYALANRALLEARAAPLVLAELARSFADVALELTEGQYLDMSFEDRADVTVEEYLRMISLKSAALIEFSVWCGATLAGAPQSTRQPMRTFGREVGRAFQIHDDLLGIWAPADATGKEVAKDLANHKKTLPVLLAAASVTGEDRVVLDRYLQGGNYEIDAVVNALEAAGARSSCERHLHRHLDSALASLREAGLPSPAADDIECLARELTGQ